MTRKFNALIAILIAFTFLTSTTPLLAASSGKKEGTKKMTSSKSKSSKKKTTSAKKKTVKKSSDKKASKPFTGKVNVNKASKEELMKLPGIGEVKADAIIKARKRGKLKTPEDLQQINGIGEQSVKKLKRHLLF